MQIRYEKNINEYLKIPGFPIDYWLSDTIFKLLSSESIKKVCSPLIGMRTGDNDRFLRLWFEIQKNKSSYSELCEFANKKWVPYNKGGGYRRWYGLNEYVVNWENNGYEIKENTKLKYGDNISWKISNEKYYFKKGITWGSVTSAVNSFRYYPEGYIFSNCGQAVIMNENEEEHLPYMEAYLNSCIVTKLLKVLSPTVGCESGYVAKLPYKEENTKNYLIENLALNNVDVAKQDWDSFETSWDFKKHPLV